VQQATTAKTPMDSLTFSRDPADYERIFNHPSVLPFVTQKGQSEQDLGPFLDNDANLAFLYDDCAFLVHYLEPHIYEVHSAALPHARGRYVTDCAALSIRFMFLASPALELLTRVVTGNVAATALTQKMRFAPEFIREGVWEAHDGPHDVTFYALRYPEWVKHQDWLRVTGEWFHGLLGEDQTHGHDPAHDLYVGAAVEMMLGRQPDKAVAYYNRWARFAGYQPISIVGREPLVVDIGSHFVMLDKGKIEVTPCP
jgi:hypothetical protein